MTFVPTQSYALNAKAGYRDGDADTNYVVAAPLSHGSNPNSNMAGRRREDDVNLVAEIAGPLGGGNEGIGRRSEDDPNLVTAFDWQAGAPSSDNAQSGGKGRKWITRAGDYTGALGETRRDAIQYGASVRRLTPTECERLQGLPDGWTQVPDDAPDSRRYAGLGDAVTANVAEWIGRRILEAEAAA